MPPIDSTPHGGEALHPSPEPRIPARSGTGNTADTTSLDAAASASGTPHEHPNEEPKEPIKPAGPKPGDEPATPKPS